MKRVFASVTDEHITKVGKTNAGRRKPKAAQRAAKRTPGLNMEQMKQVRQYVERTLERKMEDKFYDDIPNQEQLVNGTPVMVPLCVPAQGVGQIQRTGEEVTVTNLFLRMALFGNPDGIEASPAYFNQQYRIMIFQWFQDNGLSTPTASDLLQNSTQPFSWYERQNAGTAFKVLYDNKGVVSGSQGNPDAQRYFDVVIPGKALRKIKFDGASTNATNQIYLFAFSNQTLAARAPILDWNSHCKYTDA